MKTYCELKKQQKNRTEKKNKNKYNREKTEERMIRDLHAIADKLNTWSR